MTRKEKALEIATKYYSKKKLAHALRVANYAENNPLVSDYIQESLWIVGIFHDIIEDTECTEQALREVGIFKDIEIEAIVELTHHKEDESYENYMIGLSQSSNPYVLPVKRADMKDHLTLVNTLTDKLKHKYYPTVKYIL